MLVDFQTKTQHSGTFFGLELGEQTVDLRRCGVPVMDVDHKDLEVGRSACGGLGGGLVVVGSVVVGSVLVGSVLVE